MFKRYTRKLMFQFGISSNTIHKFLSSVNYYKPNYKKQYTSCLKNKVSLPLVLTFNGNKYFNVNFNRTLKLTRSYV